jgi:hypothetical protein
MQMKADMLADGSERNDIDAVEPLFHAVQKKVQSAFLRPTVRTQYQRCAFQIPSDATVRITLDSNLCVYKELPDEINSLWSLDTVHLTPRSAAHSPRGVNLSRLSGQPSGSRTIGAHASELSSISVCHGIEFNAWYAASLADCGFGQGLCCTQGTQQHDKAV